VAVAGHAGKPLLTNLSFDIPAGSLTAIVASDCHTPLTMVGLLLRHQDPTAGRILLDGTDLRSLTLRSLREQMAFAAADGMLFSATIVDNIRCGRVGHTQDQIDEAARQCAVLETIKSLPEGFATLVGPGGMNLPVSTAFRLGLARAMLGDPSVVIVQEPPETADEEELRAVDAALQRIRAERTLILIPSRLVALRAVERVYLIHQGQLQAEGTHTELLHAEALYRHLNYLLFTPFRDVSPCGANNTLTAG
jgi:subfamily B ATP-binding cassette protein MsbA